MSIGSKLGSHGFKHSAACTCANTSDLGPRRPHIKPIPCYFGALFYFAFSRHSPEAAKVSSVQSNITSRVLRPNHTASLKQAYPSQREGALFSPSDAAEEAAWLQPRLQTGDKRTRIDLRQTVVVQTKPSYFAHALVHGTASENGGWVKGEREEGVCTIS
jgi:hypothetical protein